MGISTLVFLIVVVLVVIGLRTIVRDWRRQFAAEDKAAQERRRAQLERNRAEAKRPDVIDLKRGEDGVYRPGDRT